MNRLLSAADKILSMLPFDGDKTVIGAGLKIILPVAAAKFPVILVVAPLVDTLADLLLSSGLLHKLVKRKTRE